MQSLSLAPRYRLDDEIPWLEGIDPSRHYWIWVNGERDLSIAIPGLTMLSSEQFRETILGVRELQPGQHLKLQRAATTSAIHCITSNCYAIAGEVNGAAVWHLFDQETLESLLMTGHPDWKCASQDVELGRRLLLRSWEQTIAA
jgi:hypothetical protein